MAYLRRRNGYGYICEKVKQPNGNWKERTILSLGKIKNKEEEEKMAWMAKTGREDIPSKEDAEDYYKDMINEFADRYPGIEIVIKNIWLYPETKEAEERQKEIEPYSPYLVYSEACSVHCDRKAKKVLVTIIMVIP